MTYFKSRDVLWRLTKLSEQNIYKGGDYLNCNKQRELNDHLSQKKPYTCIFGTMLSLALHWAEL